MRKIKQLGFILLLFVPVMSEAGRINNIFVEGDRVVIHHQGCHLKRPIQELTKLILPLEHCASSKGKIRPSTNQLKQVHWAQHDPKTVWVVITLAARYQFEVTSYPKKYQVCFPICDPKKWQAELTQLVASKKMLFLFQDIWFQIPLKNMLIEEFLDRSIGFIPTDIIRDGLPHFGAKRDDWKRKPRKHLGYDIYADKIEVVAAAHGRVSKLGKSYRAGRYIKLNHGAHLATVYVHISKVLVKKGQQVRRGEVIGYIDDAVGNAISPQLHFEIKVKGKSIDPLPLIEEFYQTESQIKEKIRSYRSQLSQSIQHRDKLVKQFLTTH